MRLRCLLLNINKKNIMRITLCLFACQGCLSLQNSKIELKKSYELPLYKVNDTIVLDFLDSLIILKDQCYVKPHSKKSVFFNIMSFSDNNVAICYDTDLSKGNIEIKEGGFIYKDHIFLVESFGVSKYMPFFVEKTNEKFCFSVLPNSYQIDWFTYFIFRDEQGNYTTDLTSCYTLEKQK